MGQIVSLVLVYMYAFNVSSDIRENGDLIDLRTNTPFTRVNLVIFLLISTFESVTAFVGLYGIWNWKKWGVYTVSLMGMYYIFFSLVSGTYFGELRLGLGLMDYTEGFFIAAGPNRWELPPPIIGYFLLIYGVYRAIKKRWKWFQ